MYRDSLGLYREIGDRAGVSSCLEGLASLAALQGQYERAARLFGAAPNLFKPVGVLFDGLDRQEVSRFVALARDHLGDQAWQSAFAAGQAMTAGGTRGALEKAVAFALAPVVS